MAFEWTLVSTEGYDVEDVIDPRSATDRCPACEKRVRLLERELTRNLRVFNIPLLAVERGARVFQCPHCAACYEPPPEAPSAARREPAAAPPEVVARVRALREKATRLEDEVSLWKLRVELARKRNEFDLAREAEAMVSSYEEQLRAVERQIDRLENREPDAVVVAPAPPKEEAPSLPRPPPPPERAPEPTVREVDDEMAALKRKLRAPSPVVEAAPEPVVAAPAPPTDVAPESTVAPEGSAPETPVAPPSPPSPQDELADLKNLLRRR